MAYRSQKNALRSLMRLAAAQGGYFTAKQAMKAGYAYSHLVYHLKAGNFERAAHGLYRMPTLPHADHDDLVRLSFWSRGRDDQPQAVVSHQTALGLYDLGDLIPGDIHLTVPPSFRKRPPRGCRLHKRTLADVESREMLGIRVTAPIRTLADLAIDPSMPREQLELAVRSAIERGLIRRSQAKMLRSSQGAAPAARATKATR